MISKEIRIKLYLTLDEILEFLHEKENSSFLYSITFSKLENNVRVVISWTDNKPKHYSYSKIILLETFNAIQYYEIILNNLKEDFIYHYLTK